MKEKIKEKINDNHLPINLDIKEIFGEWIENKEQIKQDFINAKPFSYVVIDNFLNKDYIEKIHEEFPKEFDNWHKYYNPLEVIMILKIWKKIQKIYFINYLASK